MIGTPLTAGGALFLFSELLCIYGATNSSRDPFNYTRGDDMTGSTIDSLLQRIALGDNDAFEQLYIGTKRGVFSFLYTYCRRPEDAEDCMQTVYLKIKTQIHTYKKGTNGRAWILQIAKYTAFDELKKQNRVDTVDDDILEISAVHTDHMNERMHITETLRRTLSEEEQRIVVLHVIGGYKHKEIAAALDLPLGTVTSKYKRSLQKLKYALKEDMS